MKITVLLFAKLREILKRESLKIELPHNAVVADALDSLFRDKEEAQKMRRCLLFAINQNYVRPDAILKNGDELTLIPPVAGG